VDIRKFGYKQVYVPGRSLDNIVTHKYIHTHTYIYIHKYTYIHTYIHTYISWLLKLVMATIGCGIRLEDKKTYR